MAQKSFIQIYDNKFRLKSVNKVKVREKNRSKLYLLYVTVDKASAKGLELTYRQLHGVLRIELSLRHAYTKGTLGERQT